MAAQTHHIDDPNEELSDASRNLIIRQCRTLFKQAVGWEMATDNPFAGIPVSRIAEKPWYRMTTDEYLFLLETAPTQRWRATYALAFTTGARLSALFNATWPDIDFDAGVLHIRNRPGTDKMPPFTVKDKECRVIPLPDATLDILAAYQQVAPVGVPYILLTSERYEQVLRRWHKVRKAKGEWNPRYLHNNVLRDFRAHAKRAGIKSEIGKLNFHDLRKACAQNWADSGLPINVTKEFLGHSDVATTTKHYSKVDALHMEYAVKAMNEMLESAKQKASSQNMTDAQQTREHKNIIKKDDKGLDNTLSSSVNHATESTSKSAANRGDKS
jgi:integrase